MIFFNCYTMATLTIKYNAKNQYLTKMLEAISQMQGVEVLEEDILTPAEIKRVEKSRKSGILYDIDKLTHFAGLFSF